MIVWYEILPVSLEVLSREWRSICVKADLQTRSCVVSGRANIHAA